VKAESFPTGDRADLRRMPEDGEPRPAFWKIAALYLDAQLPTHAGPFREDLERRWAVILAAVAEVHDLHRPGRALGHALAEAEVTEARVDRLLRAHGSTLPHLVRTTVHQLVTRGTAVDLTDLAWLVLSDGRGDADRARRKVAREYFQALYRRQRDESGDAGTPAASNA
jgi:CRISPR system Cascade subunit CasB